MRLNDLLAKKPVIMGILNITPDSFSDGGDYNSVESAIDRAGAILKQGATILDIGGESTRPYADNISTKEEMSRVIPVIETIIRRYPEAVISIDTRNAATMKVALDTGASIINDVSALQYDPESIRIAANCDAPICLMHMKGSPQNMQDEPVYDDVIIEIMSFFKERIEFCKQNGIRKDRLILDPGLGFGKTIKHNLQILKNLKEFRKLECPLLIGASRKSFIGKLYNDVSADQRLGGSIAAALYAMQNGADIVRVHDVEETSQALRIFSSIQSSDE